MRVIILFFMLLFVCDPTTGFYFSDVHGRALGATIFLVVLRAVLCVINLNVDARCAQLVQCRVYDDFVVRLLLSVWFFCRMDDGAANT